MAKQKQLSLETRQSIHVLRMEGCSLRDIAKKLKISLKGVRYSLERQAATGSNQDRSRSGRPKCTSAKEDKYLRVSSKNRCLTAPELAASLNETREKPVSTDTVRRRLRTARLKERVAKRRTKVGKLKDKVEVDRNEQWISENWTHILLTDRIQTKNKLSSVTTS